MRLSSLLMRFTSVITPQARSEWREAMQAEYQVMDRGRLSWSLGCLITATGWRMKAEAFYVALLVASALFTELVLNPLFFFSSSLTTQQAHYIIYVWCDLPILLMSAGLGFSRPKRWQVSAVAFAALNFAYLYISFAVIFPPPHGYIHFNNLPPLIGESAVLAICLAGALIGQGLRSRITSIRIRAL